MARKRKSFTRRDACLGITRGLREFGYPDLRVEEIEEILDAWIEGKREHALPHGVIGMMAGRQFDEVDEARPGVLATLPKD